MISIDYTRSDSKIGILAISALDIRRSRWAEAEPAIHRLNEIGFKEQDAGEAKILVYVHNPTVFGS